MPLPSFVNNLATKAQSAIQSQMQPRPGSPNESGQPTANQAAGQQQPAQQRSHAFEALQYQFKSLKEQYQATTPVQKVITAEKGFAIDFDSAARDAKAQSKELYTWGQTEPEDLKDVTDRLAYINFIHGSLAGSLAQKLDLSRVPLKALRDAETAIAPRRNVRAGLNLQLSRIEHDQAKGMEKKVAELKAQIKKAESDDASQEQEIELLKRKGVKDSEQIKWDALREYGEKLVLLSQAASHVTQALPLTPPSANQPYKGAQATATARASLQRALDQYTTGVTRLDLPGAGADLSRHDTRSFGQSHAKEIASIDTTGHGSTKSNIPLTPPTENKALEAQHNNHPSASSAPSHSGAAHPINPASLNNEPVSIPTHHSSHSGVTLTDNPVPQHAPSQSDASLPPVSDQNVPLTPNTPVIAETGVPILAGPGGTPGPSSGSLLDIKHERKEAHETAEEEKKRLERQEVERARKAVEAEPGSSAKKDGPEEDLPPYQEM